MVKSRAREMRCAVIGLVGLMLVGCGSTPTQPPTSTIPPTETPTPSAITTATATFTPLPTFTNTPIPTETPIRPTPSLPSLVGSDLYFGDVLFSNINSEDCPLPCWHGLEIGKSTEDDVLQVFEELVGPTYFDVGGLGMFTWGASNFLSEVHDIGFRYTSSSWAEFSGMGIELYADFSGVAAFPKDIDLLQFLGFYWQTTDSSYFEVHLSPQRVVKVLGPPSYMYAARGPLYEQVTLLLVYEEGIAFEYMNQTRVTGPLTGEYCFGDTQTHIINAMIWGRFYFLPSFDDGMENLSPLQDATVGASIRHNRLGSADEMFGVSQDKIVRRILQEDNTCFIID